MYARQARFLWMIFLPHAGHFGAVFERTLDILFEYSIGPSFSLSFFCLSFAIFLQ